MSEKIIHIIITILFLLIISLNITAFTTNLYNNIEYIEKIEKLKLAPISSIVINYDIVRNNTKEQNILNLVRLDSEYNYKYLILNNNNKDCHPCGSDENNNLLFLPNKIECPINYIKLSNSPNPDDIKFNYTTINITDKLYLHYSNNNIKGYIYNNISLVINESDISSENGFQNIYFLKYVYNSSLKNNSLNSLNKLLEFKAFFNLKEIIIYLNVITLVLIIIFYIFYILMIIKLKLSFLHLLNFLILVSEILIEIYFMFYIENNTFLIDIFNTKHYYSKIIVHNFNFLLLIAFSIMIIIYSITTSIIIESEKNNDLELFKYSFYYTIVYPFRSGKFLNIICFIVSLVIHHYPQFYSKLNTINNQISDSENKRREEKRKIENVLLDIQEKRGELDLLIEEEKNLDLKINEIKIEEKEFEKNSDKNNIIYNKLEQDIKNVEEQIDQYKEDIFKEKIYENNENDKIT